MRYMQFKTNRSVERMARALPPNHKNHIAFLMTSPSFNKTEGLNLRSNDWKFLEFNASQNTFVFTKSLAFASRFSGIAPRWMIALANVFRQCGINKMNDGCFGQVIGLHGYFFPLKLMSWMRKNFPISFTRIITEYVSRCKTYLPIKQTALRCAFSKQWKICGRMCFEKLGYRKCGLCLLKAFRLPSIFQIFWLTLNKSSALPVF